MLIKLLDYSELKDFPLGSGIASVNEQLYLVGADAGYIVIMNKNWKVQDFLKTRLAEPGHSALPVAAGFYATTVVQEGKGQSLLILGSGNEGKRLDKGYLVNLKSKENKELDLSVFYARLKATGIDVINITAAIVMDDKMLLCNSSDKNAKDNRLLVTSLEFWKKQADVSIAQIKIVVDDEKYFTKLAGLAYSYENDWLIVAASNRKLVSKSGNGAADEFFVGVVEDAYRKSDRKRLKLNEQFDLADTDEKFKGQEIKSISLQGDKSKKLKIHLVAGDHTGKRTLFKIRLKDDN